MNDNDIIKSAVDSLTGKVVFSFTINTREPVYPEKYVAPKRTFWDKLLRKPKPIPPVIEPPELFRSFEIYQAVVANQYRIASSALNLPMDLFDDPTKMLEYVPEHLPIMIYIIAAAITNSRKEPDPELITYLEDNLDNEDVLQILAASLQQVNMQAFTTSIVLMNGMAKILKPKASPVDGSELIASHIAV